MVDTKPSFEQRDYERRVQTSENLVEVAMIRLMLKWLARGV